MSLNLSSQVRILFWRRVPDVPLVLSPVHPPDADRQALDAFGGHDGAFGRS
jgi:hypothetical protein